jgi:hypothetical protein
MVKMLGGIAAAALLVALAVPAAAAGRHDPGIQSGIHKQVTDFSSQRRIYGRYYVRGGRYYVRHYVVPRYYGYGPRYFPPYPYYPPYYGSYPYYGGLYPYYRPYPYYGLRPYFPFAPFSFGVW